MQCTTPAPIPPKSRSRLSIMNLLPRAKTNDIKKELKVLVYDTESGKTTRRFIGTLKQHLTGFEFEDFNKAIEEERDTLPIIAVVRHTSIRIKEHLKDIKLRLDQDNIKNQEEVIVIYFYVNGFEDGMLDKIEYISDEIQFAEIVLMDFSGQKLEFSGKLDKLRTSVDHQKSINDKALQDIKQKLIKEWSADVIIESNLPFVNQFFENLKQDISQSIRLKVKTFEELGHGNSPTLIFTSGIENGFLKGLEEKDPKKVFLVNIIDIASADASDVTENLSTVPVPETYSSVLSADAERGIETAPLAQTISMPCQYYGKICEVHHCNGKFYEERNFLERVKRFVRT